MGKFAELVPERVRALASYVPGKRIQQAEAESGVKMIKLGSNENPFGPSPLALSAIRAAADSIHLYPDNETVALRERLAVRHGVTFEQVLVTAGVNNLLDILAPGDTDGYGRLRTAYGHPRTPLQVCRCGRPRRTCLSEQPRLLPNLLHS